MCSIFEEVLHQITRLSPSPYDRKRRAELLLIIMRLYNRQCTTMQRFVRSITLRVHTTKW